VGRSADLEAIRKARQAGARLITLLGTAGVGKTRLSKEYALGEENDHPGGVWFADLTEARDAAGVVEAVGAALGVPLTHVDPVQQLGWAIAGRGRLLLVLDNFEQVVGAANDTVGRWLEAAPDAQFVTTSRTKLGLVAESLVPVGPLSVLAALELFVSRARAHKPGFTLTGNTRELVLDIVQRLDCLPLALELAAARVGMLTVQQLSERLAGRFDLLRTRLRAAEQQTLEGAIDWSWQLLSPASKAALAQSSAFHGGFDLAAAEAVLDLSSWPESPPALDVIEALCDDHLLRKKEAPGWPVRYSMFESIRAFAAQRLDERTGLTGETLRLCHAAFYARFGTEEYRESLHTHGGTERGHHLELERENLLAGVEAGIAADSPAVAAGCALGACELFRMVGPFLDGAELLGRVAVQGGLEVHARMHLEGQQGALLLIGGRAKEAQEHMEAAITLAREVGDRRSEGVWLSSLGDLHRRQGRMPEAQEHVEAAITLAREVGDRRHEGHRLGNLGNLAREQGRMAEAQAHYEAAITIAREVGDRRNEGIQLGNLSILHRAQGPIPEAQAHMESAITIARELGDRRNESVWLGHLGILHRAQGRMPEAQAHYEAAITIAREVGDRRNEGVWLGNLGDLLLDQGDWELAAQRFEEAVRIGDETWPVIAGAFRGSLALIKARAGELDQARALLTRGEEQLRGVYALELGKLLCKRGQVEHGAGYLAAAHAALTEAETIATELGLTPDSELDKLVADLRRLLDGDPG
jgi:predicted ATPase/Tfp pilus assembly protein PilF